MDNRGSTEILKFEQAMSTKKRGHGTVEAQSSPETSNKRQKLDHALTLSVLKWSIEHVCDYLRERGLGENVCKAFKGVSYCL